MTFGPWTSPIEPAERIARLRSLRAIAMTVARPYAGDLIRALQRSESDPAALPEALALFDQLPSLARRRILCSYAALSAPVASVRRGRLGLGAQRGTLAGGAEIETG